jgi:hypothetical protein
LNNLRPEIVATRHYNFCRIHKTLRITPAMAAGISDHVWSIEELVNLLEPKSILDTLRAV